jgi:hypothetical protein
MQTPFPNQNNDRGDLRMPKVASSAIAALMLTLAAAFAPAHASDMPPTDSAALLKWLQAESYKVWSKESAPHRSMGPHQTLVVTYLNPALDKSMTAKSTAHPVGSAAVKELLDTAGKLNGWAVSVKTAANSDGGKGWYWYEILSAPSGNVVAQANGVALCTGCHTGGRDFVLIPHPLD